MNADKQSSALQCKKLHRGCYNRVTNNPSPESLQAFLERKARHIISKRVKRAQKRRKAQEKAKEKFRRDKLYEEFEFITEGI